MKGSEGKGWFSREEGVIFGCLGVMGKGKLVFVFRIVGNFRNRSNGGF